MPSYVQLGEVRTYYEEDGNGEPLVLLHPGGADSRTWETSLPGFVERFRVFRPDRRGHGHTPDVEGPITYEQMALDTIAFLEQVVGGPAHPVGHSDGTPRGADGCADASRSGPPAGARRRSLSPRRLDSRLDRPR